MHKISAKMENNVIRKMLCQTHASSALSTLYSGCTVDQLAKI